MADTPSNESAGGPWAQRGFVAAAAFLGIVIVAAVGILLINPGDSSDPRGGAPPANGSNGKPAAGSDPAASVCGLAPGSQQVPQTPPEAQWELVGTIAAPKSRAIGPGRKERVLRSCYAHSPTGALFAAANFIAVASVANTDDAVIRALTADTPARDALPDDATGQSGTRAQIAGFRIVGAARDETTVELAFNVSSQDGRRGVVGMSLPMRWQEGDWKFVVAGGSDPYNTQALDSTSGFVPWGGA